jgi:hypothetical protein
MRFNHTRAEKYIQLTLLLTITSLVLPFVWITSDSLWRHLDLSPFRGR